MKKVTIAGAFCAALPAALLPAGAQAQDAALEQAIDAVAANYMGAPIAGMTVAVARPGEAPVVRAYGYADLEGKKAARPDTRYEIGSITKQFTAAAVLRLVEAGKLSLDTPVAVYFPELADKAQGATIAHLLRHSSGLSSGRVHEDLTAAVDPATTVAFLAAQPSEFAPGSKARYNNNGYVLLGLIVEKVTGVPFAKHIEKSFLKPLKLGQTGVCEAGRLPSYLPPSRDGEDFRRAPAHHPTVNFSAGFLCSTAGDLTKWNRALMGGKVVSAESLAAMSMATTGTEGVRTRYGMGMEVMREGEALHLSHSGATSGFLAQTGHWSDNGTSVTVLVNGLYVGSVMERIEADLHLASLGKAPAYAPLEVASPERFTGGFKLGDVPIEVFTRDHVLRMQPAGQAPARLLPKGEGRFVTEHDPATEVSFTFDAEGRAENLVISRGGRAMPPALRSAP